MVNLQHILASNASLSTTLPPGLVAVFVGGTSGIGEYTVKAFAEHACSPKVYLVGRSQEAADRIVDECKKLNPEGEYLFIKSDVSLLRNIDVVCQEIRDKERCINLLFMTQGTFNFSLNTSEGLSASYALTYASRFHFAQNLLPLLQQSSSLKRVVTVFAATKEGLIDESDFSGRNITNPMKIRGHASSIVSLSLEILAQTAPDVSFIHVFPGLVKSNLGRDASGWMKAITALSKVTVPLFAMPNEECGERHVFLATSAKYPPAKLNGNGQAGAPLGENISVARGTDGKMGSGVYAIDRDGESASPAVETLLAKFRKEGVVERLREHTTKEIERITK
ncbi:hypothetical protein V5O48_016815 [Marasmius crinis-equi]|uniref:Short-chain dehydrogenases/reductase n=1 Tax=Marasmius crinis-equi TaxID=585013 RepID=A0ABR3EQM9_9AGAR